MAQTTTNYGLYKPEATDTYNHLVYDNPNMDTIDTAMKDNADHGVDNASCIKSGTVHSITRTNTSCPVFKFTATGDWNTGDTMNVDGTPVSVFLPNGTAPLTGCFVINTEVMAAISGSRVTLYCPVIPDASDIPFDNTGTTISSTNVEGALQELNDSSNIVYDASNSVTQIIDKCKKYRKIAESSSNITYAQQLSEIESVYSALPAEQKMSCILRTGNEIFQLSDLRGFFVKTTVYGNVAFSALDVQNHVFRSTNGTNLTTTDRSSETNSINIILYIKGE